MSVIFCMPFTDIIILIRSLDMFSINMYVNHNGTVKVTPCKMLHIQRVWKRLLNQLHNFYF